MYVPAAWYRPMWVAGLVNTGVVRQGSVSFPYLALFVLLSAPCRPRRAFTDLRFVASYCPGYALLVVKSFMYWSEAIRNLSVPGRPVSLRRRRISLSVPSTRYSDPEPRGFVPLKGSSLSSRASTGRSVALV